MWWTTSRSRTGAKTAKSEGTSKYLICRAISRDVRACYSTVSAPNRKRPTFLISSRGSQTTKTTLMDSMILAMVKMGQTHQTRMMLQFHLVKTSPWNKWGTIWNWNVLLWGFSAVNAIIAVMKTQRSKLDSRASTRISLWTQRILSLVKSSKPIAATHS